MLLVLPSVYLVTQNFCSRTLQKVKKPSNCATNNATWNKEILLCVRLLEMLQSEFNFLPTILHVSHFQTVCHGGNLLNDFLWEVIELKRGNSVVPQRWLIACDLSGVLDGFYSEAALLLYAGCKDKQPNCAGNGYFCKILPSFRKDCPKTCKMC